MRVPRLGPMPAQFEALALYNAERSRGLMHSPSWEARMRELQEEFDRWVQSHRGQV